MRLSEKPYRDAALLERTKKLLRSAGLKARKNLGQHFLVDETVLADILETAGLTVDDTVVEVGPGLGVLTAELCSRAGRVIAVELDDRLAAALKRTLSSSGNLTVLNNDILKISPEDILREAGMDASGGYSVVANLPYYITSPVLRHFLEAGSKPRKMVVMVQNEVAEEIAAGPGKMSLLSIGIQLYGRPEIAAYVPAASFYPPPEVDSAILKIVPYPEPPVIIPDEESFFSFVKAGFSASRKQLANSLSNGLGIPKDEVRDLLESVEIAPQRRAETLSIEEWARLWTRYREGRAG
jgi:16S rRNA (adenine1518-N6/adenine1519-N6)-dimethyltransferase